MFKSPDESTNYFGENAYQIEIEEIIDALISHLKWIYEKIKYPHNLFFFFFFFLAAVGVHCFAWIFFSCSEQYYSLLWCMAFSLCWLLFLQSTGFSSCNTQAQ